MTIAPSPAPSTEQLFPLDPDTVLVLGGDPARPYEWVLSIRRRQPDGTWRADPDPGLRFEAHQFLPLVDALTHDARVAPRVEPAALALRLRTDADSTGDPRDIRRARILQALAEAEADPDDAEITRWERLADGYLRKKHGSTWASGSKAIRRPGVPPYAFHEMLAAVHKLLSRPEVDLQQAARRVHENRAARKGLPDARPYDEFDLMAESLVLEMANQLPAFFPAAYADVRIETLSRVAEALRTLRREKPLLDPFKYHSREDLLERVLRAAGVPESTIADLFAHREKATSRRRAARRTPSRP